MGSQTPSYITKNRLGIYVFQVRNPSHFSHTKKLYRKSLKTRNRREALAMARKLTIIWDELKARHFDDEESYSRAMKVLDAYDTEAVGDWSRAEEFLMELDDWESHLLEQGLKYRKVREKWKNSPTDTATPVVEPPASSHQDNETLQRMKQTLELINQNYTPLNGKPLPELVNTYLEERSKKWTLKNRQTNLKDIRPKLDLFASFLGAVNSDEITKDHVVAFRSFIFKYPRNKTKGKYKNFTNLELAQMDIPEQDRISGTSVINYTSKISSFLQWLEKSNYSRPDLSDPLKGIKAPPKAPHEERPAWTDEELTRLFHSKQYLDIGHKQPSHYWVPLLALFTGARQSELCQLYKTDIFRDKDTGIWVIYINLEGDKNLKKRYHSRHIPIHPTLIKLGFLEYVNSLDHERVFPDLPKKRDGYGQKFSRWFCDTYINEKNCNTRKNTSDPDGVFHSFRHTFITKLDHEQNVPQHHIALLTGQKPSDGSVTTTRYIKPHVLKARKKIIDKVSYSSIDFTKIRPWRRGFKPWSGN